MTSCTILSLGGAIVRGLLPPFAFGIWILRPGLNWNDWFFMLSIVALTTSVENPSRVVGVIPGVMFPGLLLRL